MNFKLVLLLSIVSVSLALEHNSNYVMQFSSWMKKHNKSYTTEEYSLRFGIFKDNVKKIAKFNSQSKSAKFALNKYADLSAVEFKKYYLGTKPFKADPKWPMLPALSNEKLSAIPTSWDWSTMGVVTGVKNQGQCGSCWSFSTTGNVEGQWALANHTLVGLSEQQLVDCDHQCMMYEGEESCDAGCEGGLMPNAFQYIINNGGIGTETEYPYDAYTGTCQKNYTDGAQITAWTMVPSNETQMAGYLVNTGPLSIAVDAELWQFYFGGVFDFPWCGTTLDHGVLIVGYGVATDWVDQPVDFWKIKNSWGADWGEAGYIRVERNENECGVDLFPCTSTISKKK